MYSQWLGWNQRFAITARVTTWLQVQTIRPHPHMFLWEYLHQ